MPHSPDRRGSSRHDGADRHDSDWHGGFRQHADTSSQVTYVVDMAAAELQATRQVFSQLARLLEQSSTSSGPGIRRDRAMRRLFPDGYRDDADAAAELRRFSEGTLRSGKLQAVHQVLADLPDEDRQQVRLSSGQAQVWLTALTDARLVLGVRLGIGADTDVFAELDAEPDLSGAEPKGFLIALYQYLTFLQESLVEALTQRVDYRTL
ncbi:MAG: DUF2017 domain-containing protein [Mycobacteriales bacterium]